MTDLMKRYEAETGKVPDVYMNRIGYVATDEYVAWLEAQLTWRPVSEKPKRDGGYTCTWERKGYAVCLYQNNMWHIWDDEVEEWERCVFPPTEYLPILLPISDIFRCYTYTSTMEAL
jgi:hypothetical protein